MKLKKLHTFILKNEKKLFYLLVFLNLIPLFTGTFFPTLDGPAHLYNARLILDLISGSSSSVNQFFQLNELVPNLTGHAINAVFLAVLPPHLAEKLFLVLYAIGLPWSFRYLLASSQSTNVIFSFLILPFVYSYLFLLGFYNFSISLIFMFLSIGYWLRLGSNIRSFSAFIILSLLCFLTFSSHLVVYGLSFSFMLAQTGIRFLRSIEFNRERRSFNIIEGLNEVVFLLFANVVPLFFTVAYFIKRPSSKGDYSYISWDEGLSYFTSFRPLIAFNIEIEQQFTKLLFYLFVLLTAIALGIVLKKFFDRKRSNLNQSYLLSGIVNHPSLYALMICFICLMAFLILPDSDGFGGYISIRMALLFLIFMIYLFSTAIPQKWIALLCVPLIIMVIFNLNIYYSKVIRYSNKIATEIVSASDLIEPNSVIMPINVSDNWTFGHISNYLGVTKPMVILENYEANVGYFPVKWNDDKPIVGEYHDTFKYCTPPYPVVEDNNAVLVDYLFVVGSLSGLSEECSNVLLANDTLWEKSYQSENLALFKRLDN